MPSTVVTGASDEDTCKAKNCGEGNLDTQYITGIAPNTLTYFINALDGPETSPLYLVMWMAGLTVLPVLPRVASISYGPSEHDFTVAELSLFDVEAIKVSVMGVTIVASSGDDGANARSARGDPSKCGYTPQFPATSQYVLAVGATSGPGMDRFLLANT